MRPGKFDEAKDLLALRLRSLDPAGPDGFEGLMRDVLTEITGQAFRLAKSGPQGGSDVRTIGHNAMRIGLEGKRYGADTTLRLDELRPKVVDAAMQEDPVDVWILAATREISATDVEGLEQTGREHGITVLNLDWPARPDVLPDLAVICAEAPHALASHLGSDPDLLAAIALVKAHPDFTSFVATAVAAVRATVAIALIALVALMRGSIDQSIAIGASATMLAGHAAFNLALFPLAALCKRIAHFLETRLANESEDLSETLAPRLADDNGLARPAIKRKLSAMLDLASGMLEEAMSANPDREKIATFESRMNSGLVSVRDIYSRLNDHDESALSDVRQIVDFAIRVERCGDVLSGKFLALRLDQVQGRYRFTEDGSAEIAQLVDAVRQSIVLAHETTWTGDLSSAERLVRHKQHVSDLEEQSRHKHLARLRTGNLTSSASSNQHLEIIAALKEINSKFATIAYAVLEQHGALKKTRLRSSISASAT